MHLIYDENGNPVPHGAGHEHGGEGHCHEHGEDGHCHEHHCHGGECASGDKCKNESVMLLEYMKNHNEQHAAELDKMAAKLDEQGLHDAAKQIRDAVSDFQKGNMRISLALALVKEQLKEV